VSALVLDDIQAGYDGADVLRGCDLSVAEGELLVVLGPSGAGKSTLLRIVAGLERPRRGRVIIGGTDVTDRRAGRRNVSMVFQNYALFPHLTVVENIAFGLQVRGMRRGEAHDRARRVAELVGCGDLLGRRPSQLSGGERQRVALARAMVREPDVFLLDEPLSNLDAELRAQTRDELKALHTRVGATMLHVTHDQVEALILGNRVAVLHAGRVEQIGSPEEIWRRPATQFVGCFVGTPRMNLLPPDSPLLPAGLPVSGITIGVRPEALRLGAVGTEDTEDTDGVLADVGQVDVIGADAHVHLRVGEESVRARVPADARPSTGKRAWVTVRPADLHVFDAGTGRRVEWR